MTDPIDAWAADADRMQKERERAMTEPTPLSAAIEALLDFDPVHPPVPDHAVYGEIEDEWGVSVTALRATLDAARATVPAAEPLVRDRARGALYVDDLEAVPAADDRERLARAIEDAELHVSVFDETDLSMHRLTSGEAAERLTAYLAVRAGVRPSTGEPYIDCGICGDYTAKGIEVHEACLAALRSPSTGDAADDRERLVIDNCITIVQQSLDTVRAEDDGESRTIKASIGAREHVIQMLTGYRDRSGVSPSTGDAEAFDYAAEKRSHKGRYVPDGYVPMPYTGGGHREVTGE